MQKLGWQGNFQEARHLSSIHMQLHDKFDRDVRDDVEGWKKAHFPKSFLQFKSYKRAHSVRERRRISSEAKTKLIVCSRRVPLH